MNLLKSITDQICNLLLSKGINELVDLRVSNIDSCDYQINNLVKYQNHSDINLIKTNISRLLDSSDLIEGYNFTENQFLNLRINANSIIQNLENVKSNVLKHKKESVIIDYGGPNIGKPLHVGHLRPLNIGRSIYLTNKIIGNDINSDIHLGDWGMPVAQIITYCELEDLKLDDISIEMLEEIYPNASTKYKTDKKFKEKAQETNKLLTSGDKVTLKNWEKISDITISALRETLAMLHHDFDYWWGESTVNDLIPEMLKNLETHGKIEKDDGAVISRRNYRSKNSYCKIGRFIFIHNY